MMRIKLSSHEHSLYPLPWVSNCNGCRRKSGYRKDGYGCYECKTVFHKGCAETSSEINHLSHPEHPLQLSLTDNPDYQQTCYLCNERGTNVFYHCWQCNFVVDTACARNPPPDVIEYPKAHEHSLAISKFEDYYGKCDVREEDLGTRYPYECSQCQLTFHFECSNLPLEIAHPLHPKHLLTREEQHHHHLCDDDGKCRICGNALRRKFYNCSICKFSVDFSCIREPPPLSFLYAKAHEHQLNLMPRNISFNCDACGVNGVRSPYSCHQCDFMIHQSCIDLPEIINVNRHEHRLSRRIHLSPRSFVCGVCRKRVDWSYGAYSCSICPNYVVHSRCAIRDDVWDRIELKGIPEETDQEIEPFKEINGNLLICHFSHEEHYLKLKEESIVCGGSVGCEACVSPIYNSQAFYRCVECNFILHKTCANLPRKKRHVHDSYGPVTLICGDNTQFTCFMCYNISSGFRYVTKFKSALDVKCGAFSDYIYHESHPCPLYYIHRGLGKCVACGEFVYDFFRCDDCKFVLDFKCAALPITTKHWYDERPLSLCYVNNNNNTDYGKCNWCDICEKEIDTVKWWFYTCDICCVSFHTKCILGDFSFLMQGRAITYNDELRYETMQTNPGFLPRCSICRNRRAVPLVLKVFNATRYIYVCSYPCLFHTITLCKDLDTESPQLRMFLS